MTTEQDKLTAVHRLRQQAHWGKGADLSKWPQNEAEWRQAPHGAPWDANVNMARWHLKLANDIRDAGLLDD
jgi:hypothetical protein